MPNGDDSTGPGGVPAPPPRPAQPGDSFDVGNLLDGAWRSALPGARPPAATPSSPASERANRPPAPGEATSAGSLGPGLEPRYTLRCMLGRGGMGVVYGAVDQLGRSVALKVISAQMGGDPVFIQRLRREAKVLARVQSPRVVHVHTFYGPGELPASALAVTGDADPGWIAHVQGSPVLVMEWVDGESLQKRLARGRMSTAAALRVGYLLARSLHVLHNRRGADRIEHRDLKPANVMLIRSRRSGARDGAVRVLKLVDMGLAHVGADGTPAEGFSPYYAAPEVLRMESMGASADMWAFGVVLYECLVGARPFAAETLADYTEAVLFEPPAMHRLPAAVPDSIRRLIEQCLSKELADRPASLDAIRLLQPWALPDGRAPNNLPSTAKHTPFARGQLVRHAAREVQSERASVICLHGLPGVGKRRIAHAAALQVANLRVGRRPRVVCLTTLDGIDPAASASDVAIRVLASLRAIPAVAHLVRRDVADHDPVQLLATALGRKPALLAIDGIDLAEAGFREFAEELRRSAPATTLLTTARRPPAIFHAALLPIEPLRVPKPDDDLRAIARSPAVRYFIEIAQSTRVGQRIPLTPANAAIIARICRTVGGLPHAIELVAPRAETLQLAEIERLLAGCLASTSAFGMSRALSTMNAALGLAVDGLDPTERRLLARLSIFKDSFSLEAAERICRDDERGGLAADDGAPATLDGAAIVDVLCGLVRRHLVTRSGLRYRHVEPVRHYVSPTLELEPDVAALRERWRRWFAALIERGLPEHLPDAGPACAAWFDAIAADSENVRQALAMAADTAHEATALASFIRALEFYWYGRGPMPEGWAWCQVALARIDELDTPLQRVRLLAASAKTAARVGRFGDAERCYRQGIAEATGAGLARQRTQLTTNLAMVLHRTGRLDEGEALAQEGLQGYRSLGEGDGELVNLGTLAVIRKLRGDLDSSEAILSEILRRVSHRPGVNLRSAAEQNLGEIDVARGRFALALQRFRDAWRGHRGSDRCEELRALSWIGIALSRSGDRRAGRKRIDAAAPLYRAMLGSPNEWFERWVGG